jgi:hypothetical protein
LSEVQSSNRSGSIFVPGHRDKSETLASPGYGISCNLDSLDLPKPAKRRFEIIFFGG